MSLRFGMLLDHKMPQDHTKSLLNLIGDKRPFCQKQAGDLLLRLLLILALAWLPMGGLMASVSTPGSAMPAMKDSVATHHQHQSQQLSSHMVDSVKAVSIDTAQVSCAGHLALCCSACITFYASPVIVLMPPSLFIAERYQHYSVPISLVVLARDIRPPIV